MDPSQVLLQVSLSVSLAVWVGIKEYSLLLWTTLIGPFMILIWQLDGVCLLIVIKSALLFSDAR